MVINKAHKKSKIGTITEWKLCEFTYYNVMSHATIPTYKPLDCHTFEIIGNYFPVKENWKYRYNYFKIKISVSWKRRFICHENMYMKHLFLKSNLKYHSNNSWFVDVSGRIYNVSNFWTTLSKFITFENVS